jgi:hypothetical protein
MQQTTYKQQADFPGGFTNYFPLVLDRIIQLNKNATDTLVILVKRFRLADHIDHYKVDPELILSISAGFYCKKNDDYARINSIDKVYAASLTGAHKRKGLDSFRTQGFGKLMEAVFSERNWTKTTTVFTREAIESGIRQRFNLPIFTDSTIQAGCYRNFTEFIMNNPSIKNVKPVYKQVLTGFKTAEGKIIPVDSCWGACDGRNVYVVFRKTFNMLFMQDHSFVLRSYRSTADVKPPPDYGSAALQYGIFDGMFVAGIEWSPEVFYLNMEYGTIFLEEVFGEYTKTENHKDVLRKKN